LRTGARSDVTVHDLSKGGARLSGEGLALVAGQEVSLSLAVVMGGRPLPARVLDPAEGRIALGPLEPAAQAAVTQFLEAPAAVAA
jgi:hypothetical protein